MTTFTPGPWSLDIEPEMGPDGDDYFYIGCNRGAMPDYPHCSSVVDPEHGITRVEDAHLIESAPELYAALDDAPLPSMGADKAEHYQRFYDWYEKQAKPALKKARGEV